MKKVLCSLVLGLITLAGVGCVVLSEWVTPAEVDKAAVEYADEAGVIDANDFVGYANLDKAKRLATAVKAAYQVNGLAIEQLREKNDLDYQLLSESVANAVKIGTAREESLFGESGLLSLGLTALGVGGFGGLLGLMRKRPGDWTAEEVQSAVAEVSTESEKKDVQLAEVVKGVQSFLDTYDDQPYVKELKTLLSVAQSADTKKAVATIKATAW